MFIWAYRTILSILIDFVGKEANDIFVVVVIALLEILSLLKVWVPLFKHSNYEVKFYLPTHMLPL